MNRGQAEDLTSSQKSVLIRLEREGPATVSTLARAESVRPQSLGATVAALETAGLVSGAPRPQRRAANSSLPDPLPAGNGSRPAGRRKRIGCIAPIQANLSSKEQTELTRAVELLQRLADS